MVGVGKFFAAIWLFMMASTRRLNKFQKFQKHQRGGNTSSRAASINRGGKARDTTINVNSTVHELNSSYKIQSVKEHGVHAQNTINTSSFVQATRDSSPPAMRLGDPVTVMALDVNMWMGPGTIEQQAEELAALQGMPELKTIKSKGEFQKVRDNLAKHPMVKRMIAVSNYIERVARLPSIVMFHQDLGNDDAPNAVQDLVSFFAVPPNYVKQGVMLLERAWCGDALITTYFHERSDLQVTMTGDGALGSPPVTVSYPPEPVVCTRFTSRTSSDFNFLNIVFSGGMNVADAAIKHAERYGAPIPTIYTAFTNDARMESFKDQPDVMGQRMQGGWIFAKDYGLLAPFDDQRTTFAVNAATNGSYGDVPLAGLEAVHRVAVPTS